jgi:hypothetical protein
MKSRSTMAYVRVDGSAIPITRVITITVTSAVAPSGPIRVAWPTIESMAIPAAVIPRAGANEYSIHKPTGPVVAIGSASVWVVSVVAISANRRCSNANTHWPYSNAYRNLSVSASCNSKKQNSQKCSIFQITHDRSSIPPETASSRPGSKSPVRWASTLHKVEPQSRKRVAKGSDTALARLVRRAAICGKRTVRR